MNWAGKGGSSCVVTVFVLFRCEVTFVNPFKEFNPYKHSKLSRGLYIFTVVVK